MNAQIFRQPNNPHQFKVQSFTGRTQYIVTMPAHWNLWLIEATCTCPQHTERGGVCKHIAAVIQRICISAPLRLRVNPGGAEIMDGVADREFERDITDPWYRNCSTGQLINAAAFLWHYSSTMLAPPPTDDDYIRAQVRAEARFTLRDGVIYDLDGEALAINAEPSMFDRHIHTASRPDRGQVFAHPSNVVAFRPFPRMVETPGFVAWCQARDDNRTAAIEERHASGRLNTLTH